MRLSAIRLEKGEIMADTTEKKKGVGYSVLSFRYGVGIMFGTMMTAMISTFWAVFLTGTAGLDTVLMASVLSVTALIDTISLPFLGAIMQKVRLFKGRMGMFRPWLLMGAIFTGLFFWLRFTQLGEMGGMAQAIWFGVTCAGYNLCFNLAYTAYNSVMPLMAPRPDERTAFSAMRNMCNSGGQFIFSLIAVSCVAAIGGGNDVLGYSLFALCVAACYILAYFQLQKACKPFDNMKSVVAESESDKKPADQYDASLFQMIRYTLSKPFVLFICGGMFRTAMYMTVNGLAGFFYLYVVGDKAMLTWFLSCSTAFMIVGSLIAPYVGRFTKGSRNLYCLGVVIYVVCLGSACVIGTSAISMTALMVLGYVGWSFAHSCEIAYYSSVVDYSSLRAGRDLKPFMMMLFSLIPKIGITIGSAVMGFGLVAIGFDAGAVTEEAAAALRFLFSGLPAILGCVTIVCTLLNPMNGKMADRVAKELEESDLM